jgi:hypothetical protein
MALETTDGTETPTTSAGIVPAKIEA